MRRLAPMWCVILLVSGGNTMAAGEGKVTMPVTVWEQMLDRLEQAKVPSLSPVGVCQIQRRIEGVFRKGLFNGTLTASFEVLDTRGHIRVPVLDSAASLGEVLLNGSRTSLFKEGGMYTLGVEKPGSYDVRVKFYWGKEQDRFARRLRFRLPGAGSTQVSVMVPEKDIEPKLANGALVSVTNTPQGTRLTGNLDASGLMDLSWIRKLTHKSKGTVRTEARLNTLFTIHEALVSGVAFFDVSILEGETDRLDLRVPEGIEVLRVEGDAVLQWRTEAGDNQAAVTVLLRYLVEDQVRVAVHFQFPIQTGKPVTLRMPLPGRGTPVTGAVGVQGPAGLDVRVAGSQAAKALTLRDLPRELTDLTSSPLLYGFSFSSSPTIKLAVARHEEVKLTSTLIDEIQASSVLIEDGTEVTKLKLRIRNNTEQYLTMQLPAGAILTHSLIDGRPVRPAVTTEDNREALKFPLRQSEKIGAGRDRFHTVREGETLSDISNLYYSDPSKWRGVLDNNRDQMANEMDMTAGQTLRIPTKLGVTVEESSFVIELAYKKQPSRSLGFLGSVVLTLPKIQVDTMRVTWHLYFPTALMPLSFDANLTQYSAIRYDPFRRVRDFLYRVFWTPFAWAGGKYKSILSQRKVIYRTESERRGRGEVVLAAFPLTGQRYRFKRVLMGTETPHIRVTYVDADLAPLVRWAGFLATFILGLLLLGKNRSVRLLIISGAALVVLLFLAHYFLGLHRRLLWGVDLALLVTIFRLRAGPLWQGFKDILISPWTIGKLLSFRNLVFLVGLAAIAWVVLALPLLLSSISAVVLFFWWLRKSRQARKEVAHA